MKKIIVLAIASGLVLFLSSSCSKKNSSAPNSNCKLAEAGFVEGSTTQTFFISYNNDGKISNVQIQNAGGNNNTTTKVFIYTGNLIMITSSYTNGSSSTVDSIVLNSSGMIGYWLTRDIQNSFEDVNIFTYASNGQLQKSTEQYNGGDFTTTTYTYTNGDLTSASDGTTTVTYSYYMDKPNADGDYLKFIQMISYGALYIKNSNLIRDVKRGTDDDDFSYTFDDTGRITGFSGTARGTPQSVTYQYNCN